ncbi:hypothetical protein H9P43_008693 [Blastocladiella emersonii ATCC 22665]|nr:hypothetical protein H9P43_008693 [Blastocladiella emersonii ATCC 22665]
MSKRAMWEVIEEAEKLNKEPWEMMYQEGVTPWDKGVPAPALAKLIQEGRIPEGRICVPGCGRGCDVYALATPTRQAVGVDISPSAVADCIKMNEEENNPHALFLCVDFFKFTEADLDPAKPAVTPQFDALYDYTFLCALPPSMRDDWASRVADIVRPGGTLVTLMFPLDDHEDGPPFAQSVDGYRALLAEKFDEVEIADCESFPTRAGKEKIGVWKRK